MNVLNCCNSWKAGQPIPQFQVFSVVVYAEHPFTAISVAYPTARIFDDQAYVHVRYPTSRSSQFLKDPDAPVVNDQTAAR